ncbi:site-specific integrase [Robiginitalea sediminis]|uniref:site-specific integrase n=1 Tax=Robiginitalea sediminis TaxID=1982593 RepID=UPI000B4AB07B|nr:site-specific integrase [Robiginitalea sediminis]
MRSKKTFSILFWTYFNRSSQDLTPIYSRITVNGKRVNFSLKIKVNKDLWDPNRQRAKGNSQAARVVNHYLDQAHAKLIQCYNSLDQKNELITAKIIKAMYLGEFETRKTLQDLITYHNRKTENTLAEGTKRNFGVTTGYLNRFLKEKKKKEDVFLGELNYELISDFEAYLFNYWPKGHPKAMSQNTVMKHLQRFKKIVTLGYHLEWIDKDPFLRWKPNFTRTDREFLIEEELKALEDYKFLLDRLDRVRDLFVFSCYTGISYADMISLTKKNIQLGIDGSYWIITKRAKTKVPVKVPILKKAKEIINKYDQHPITEVSNSLLPVITNEKLNLYLKEVAEAVGIQKNLTFHMARHTFATIVTLSNGVPIETVSKLLGHTKIATTQIYARVLERKISEDMALLELKLKN